MSYDDIVTLTKLKEVNKKKLFFITIGLLIFGWILSVLRWEMPKKISNFVPGNIRVLLYEYDDLDRFQNYINAADSGLNIKKTSAYGNNEIMVAHNDYEEYWRPKMAEYSYSKNKTSPEMLVLSSELSEKREEVVEISKQIENLPFVEKVRINRRTSVKEYIPRINVYFIDIQVDKYKDQILTLYPQLELVLIYKEQMRVEVKVPEGKEKYWEKKFESLEYVEWAELDYIANIRGSDF